jgi:formate dehydrogenase gamma subunit
VRPADDVGQGEDCRARWPEELGQEISAAVAVPDDRNIGAYRKLEIDRVQEVDAVGVH